MYYIWTEGENNVRECKTDCECNCSGGKQDHAAQGSSICAFSNGAPEE